MLHAVQCNLMGKHNAEVSWERIVEVCLNNRHSFAALAGVSEGPAENDAPPVVQPMVQVQGQPAVPDAYVQTPAHVRHPDACFKVDTPCKLCQLMKKNAKEGSYVHEKTRPESHRFEECYANPKSDNFKV